MLTADELREFGKTPKIHLVAIEAWNGKQIAIQELDGLQILEFDMASGERSEKPQVALTKGTGAEHLTVLSVVACELDADGKPVPGTGKRIFSSNATDIAVVRNWGGALQEIYGKILRLNRLLKRFDDDAEKNSQATPSSDSGST